MGTLLVPGHATNLDYSRAKGAGGDCLDIFSLACHFSFFLPLTERRPNIDETLSQRAVKPKTTNQPTNLKPVGQSQHQIRYSIYMFLSFFMPHAQIKKGQNSYEGMNDYQ